MSSTARRASTAGEESEPRRGPVPIGHTLANGRFELRGVLGQGGFGTVYEAYDRRAAAPVALKVLSRSCADALMRFKREFRSLHELQHRNLVQLKELLQSEGQWLLSMELVEGVDFLSYVRSGAPAPGFDEERLRACSSQLAQGLVALHAAGKVHRDIKPSNIRVTPTGRVVLLDFGLVIDVHGDRESTAADVLGTVLYMAPEQARSEPASPAADWYAFGVVLFEALTGDVPFEGASLDVLLAKQHDVRYSPRERVPEVPRDLDTLCAALLSNDPMARPTGEVVLRLLGATHASVAPSTGLAHTESAPDTRTQWVELVGRDAELRVLRTAFDDVLAGKLATCIVRGDSGVGKSRLVQELLMRVSNEHGDALVLSGRCHEHETVPYKALDQLIEQLGRELRRLPEDAAQALVPRNAGLAPLMFPALARVRAITAKKSAAVIHDPVQLKALVFDVLRRIIRRLAETRPLVLVIDDFQWTDVESVPLLDEILRSPEPPSLLLVLVSRPDSDCLPHVRTAIASVRDAATTPREISLAPLDDASTVELARRLLPGDDQVQAERIAREAAGHPVFVEALARYSHAHPSLSDVSLKTVLDASVAALGRDAEHVLRIASLAGAPLPDLCLEEAAALDGHETFAAAVRALKAARLLRTIRQGERELLETAHDQIRGIVAAGVGSDAPMLHGVLAAALSRFGYIDRERIAVHYRHAGELGKAAHAAVVAGDAAVESLAYAKAARMYQMAIEIAPAQMKGRRIELRLANALACSGRLSEAGEVFLKAAEGASASEGIELRRRGAELLLRAGHVTRGLDVARQLLRSLGQSLPSSNAAALSEASWHMLVRTMTGDRFRERPLAEIQHEELVLVDVLWSLASSLGPARPFLAAALQGRHYRLVKRLGEPGRLAEAFAMDSSALHFMGRVADVPKRLEQARQLSERAGRAEVRGLVEWLHGQHFGWLAMRNQACVHFDRALDLLQSQEQPQMWLINPGRQLRNHCLLSLADWPRFASVCLPSAHQAMTTGDPSAMQHALALMILEHLRTDQVQRASEAVGKVLELTRPEAPLLPEVPQSVAAAELYAKPQDLSPVLKGLEVHAQSGRIRVPAYGMLNHVTTGLCSLWLLGPRGAIEAKRRLKLTKKLVFSLGLEAQMKLLEANLAAHEGAHARAVELLRNAIEPLERSGNVAWAELARLRLAQLVADDEGRHLREEVIARTAGHVARPVRFLNVLLPGLLDPERID